MKLDKIFKFLVPKSNGFFPMFEGQAKCIVDATELLVGLMSVTVKEEREEFVKNIKKIESEGDKITSNLQQQLSGTFITPFDREDIHQLSSHLDDVLDNIYSISQRISWYKPKPKKMSPELLGFIEVIKQMSAEVQAAVFLLRNAIDDKDKILTSCNNINDLEKKADTFFYSHMSNLFENEKNVVDIIKDKDIFQSFEKTANSVEDVSDVIRTILIKYL